MLPVVDSVLSSTVALTVLPRMATEAPAPTPLPAMPTPTAPEYADSRRISSATTAISVASTEAWVTSARVSFCSRCTCAMPAMPAAPAPAPLTATPLKSERLRAFTSRSRDTKMLVARPLSPTCASVVAVPMLTSAVPATAAPPPSAPAPPTSEAALSLWAFTASDPARRVPPSTLARVSVVKWLTTPVAAPPVSPAAAPTTIASAFWLPLASTVTASAADRVAPSMLALAWLSNRLVESAPAPENTPALAAMPAT